MVYNAAITSISDVPQNNRANTIFFYNLTMKKIFQYNGWIILLFGH